jgi:hypothetical protein
MYFSFKKYESRAFGAKPCRCVLAGLGLFLLIIACLVGYHSLQALMVTALNIASILMVYLVGILPAAGGEVSALHIQNLATSLMLAAGGGFVGFLSLRLLKKLVLTAEVSTEERSLPCWTRR